MRCNPSEHPVFVTEPAWNTPANRERMAEIMFEEEEEEEEGEEDEEENEGDEDELSSEDISDDDIRIFPVAKTVFSNITGQPKRVYPNIEPNYDSDSSTEDVSSFHCNRNK